MGYCDLNVRVPSRISCEELQRLGYSCVAVNYECTSDEKPKQPSQLAHLPTTFDPVGSTTNNNNKKANKSKLPNFQVLTPRATTATTATAAQNNTSIQVRQLKRITLKVEDMSVAQSLSSSSVVGSYDLVAVEPSSSRVFQYVCEQADGVDLITFDMTNRLPFPLRKTHVDAAIKRNMFFEISYTWALGDSSGRRYFFSNALALIRITKGRNLVLTSGATRELSLRSPYDVVNLGMLLELSHGQAMDAVSSSALALVERAAKRRGKDVEMI